MAKKKSDALHILLVVGGILIALYFVLKILPALGSRAQTSGSSFGGGGVSSYDDPYGYGYGQQSTNPLSSLLSYLSSLFGSKSAGGMKLGGSASGGSGGSGRSSYGSRNTPLGSTGGTSLDDWIDIVTGFDPWTGQAEGSQANPELGGSSLFDFSPTYDDGGYQIPEAPGGGYFGGIVDDPNQFLNIEDFNPYPFDPSGLDSGGGDQQLPDLGAIFGSEDDDE